MRLSCLRNAVRRNIHPHHSAAALRQQRARRAEVAANLKSARAGLRLKPRTSVVHVRVSTDDDVELKLDGEQ